MLWPKRICLYALKQSTVGHTAIGLRRHPQCQAARYTDLDYSTSTAKTLEQGLFDVLFIADALGVPDVYGRSADVTRRQGAQTPTDDPLLTTSAMAAATRHLGLAVTSSTRLPGIRQWVVPELQRRGRVWREYKRATLREYPRRGHPRALPFHPAGILRDVEGLRRQS